MRYLSQFLIILGFTLAGETLHRIIPLPVPASVYGLVLLFLALCLGLLKVERVKQAGDFLISVMPVLFVSPMVGIAERWGLIAPHLVPDRAPSGAHRADPPVHHGADLRHRGQDRPAADPQRRWQPCMTFSRRGWRPWC